MFVFALISVPAFAQNFYFRAGFGYAVPQAGQTMDGTATPYNGTQNHLGPNTDAYSIKAASFSAGIQGVLGFGYMINRNVGIQLDAGVGIASRKWTYKLSNVMLDSILSDVSIVQQSKTPVFAMPSLVLQSGGDKVNLYSRFGLVLPLKTKITQDQIISNAPGTGALTVDDFTFEVVNSFSLGISGAAGVRYKLNDRISIWGEVSLISLSVYCKTSDLVAVSENGRSVPLSYVNGTTHINYSKNITADSLGQNQPTFSQPFSNVGLNAGISVNLSNNRRRPSKFNSDMDQAPDGKKPYRRR